MHAATTDIIHAAALLPLVLTVGAIAYGALVFIARVRTMHKVHPKT